MDNVIPKIYTQEDYERNNNLAFKEFSKQYNQKGNDFHNFADKYNVGQHDAPKDSYPTEFNLLNSKWEAVKITTLTKKVEYGICDINQSKVICKGIQDSTDAHLMAAAPIMFKFLKELSLMTKSEDCSDIITVKGNPTSGFIEFINKTNKLISTISTTKYHDTI